MIDRLVAGARVFENSSGEIDCPVVRAWRFGNSSGAMDHLVAGAKWGDGSLGCWSLGI